MQTSDRADSSGEPQIQVYWCVFQLCMSTSVTVYLILDQAPPVGLDPLLSCILRRFWHL